MLDKMNKRMYLSHQKQAIRDAFIDTAVKYRCGHMLTLAGPRCVDAIMFASRIRTARIVSIESDAEVFAIQQKAVAECRNVTLLNTELADFLNGSIGLFQPFDCVFFDYNSIYTKKIEDDITALFTGGKFVRDGVFALTVVKGRESPQSLHGTRLLRGVCCNSFHEYMSNRERCIDTTVHQIARDCVIDLSLVMETSYNNSNRSVAMMAFVYKTTNRKDKK